MSNVIYISLTVTNELIWIQTKAICVHYNIMNSPKLSVSEDSNQENNDLKF